MAEHHTCDRCGKPSEFGAQIFKSITVNNFQQRGPYTSAPARECLLVALKITVPGWESDVDLCTKCRVEAVLLALKDMLTPQDDSAPEAVVNPKTVRDVLFALLPHDHALLALRETE